MPLGSHPKSLYSIADAPSPESSLRFDSRIATIDRDAALTIVDAIRTSSDFGSKVIDSGIASQRRRLGFRTRISPLRDGAANYDPRAKRTVFGELLSNDRGLLGVEIQEPAREGPYHTKHATDEPEIQYSNWTVSIYGIGGGGILDSLDDLEQFLNSMSGAKFESRQVSEKFSRVARLATSEIVLNLDELVAARLLSDTENRNTALLVARASGGITHQSLSKPVDDLMHARVIKEDPSSGKLFLTDLGRSTLAGSNWMTVTLADAVTRCGVPDSKIALNVIDRGHETDAFLDVCGELVMIELKADHFSMGHAYAFGSKIRFYRPDHALVLTTASLDADARVHLEESKPSPPPNGGWFVGFRDDPVDTAFANLEIVEQVSSFDRSISSLIESIRLRHAAMALERILSAASLSPIDVLNGVASALNPDRPTDPKPTKGNCTVS